MQYVLDLRWNNKSQTKNAASVADKRTTTRTSLYFSRNYSYIRSKIMCEVFKDDDVNITKTTIITATQTKNDHLDVQTPVSGQTHHLHQNCYLSAEKKPCSPITQASCQMELKRIRKIPHWVLKTSHRHPKNATKLHTNYAHKPHNTRVRRRRITTISIKLLLYYCNRIYALVHLYIRTY